MQRRLILGVSTLSLCLTLLLGSSALAAPPSPNPAAAPVTTAPLAAAQKKGRAFHQDDVWGYKFKPLSDYKAVPVQDRGTSLVGQLAGPDVQVKFEDGVFSVAFSIEVLALTEANQEEAEEGEEGRSVASRSRSDVYDYLKASVRGSLPKEPSVDEEVKVGKLKAHHRTWRYKRSGTEWVYDTWTFRQAHADVVLIYQWAGENKKIKKALKVFKQSAKTFALVERVAKLTVGKKSSYEDRLKAAQQECESNGDWHTVETPSKRYIVVTSSDDKKFIKLVIERLEKSRDIYERDFPPPADFDAVSIVRICGSEEEFHKYGNTGGGVAGWFSPQTAELVLYDAQATNRNGSYAVMTHEAFHQYCHYLFGEAEAHRWYDEGHGDYYGGLKLKGSRAKITEHMPGGLDRHPIIKEMVRTGTWKPLVEHLNYDHGQWQSQGPSNVSCYAQSWSIIYMLRQGALGNVKRKCWLPEYADVIPNYVSTLNAAYAEEREKALKEFRETLDDPERELTEREETTAKFALRRKLPDIWKKAMDASWGQIDLDQFQEHWLLYVSDYL